MINPFKPGDKVICIDTSTTPIRSPYPFQNFSFPNGYSELDSIYCIESVGDKAWDNVRITGKPVLCHGKIVSWNHKRFRKIARRKNHKKQKALADLPL